MKNKIIKNALPASIILLIFACNTKQAEPVAAMVDTQQIKNEIQAKEDSFATLYNTGELRNIGYYADDATVFYQNKAPLVGRQCNCGILKIRPGWEY